MKKEKDENQIEMKLDNFAENEKNAKKEKLIEEIKKEGSKFCYETIS